ncbi:IS3 family transposase [Staphylococcus haemolyticus]|uniref:IS3 family transposase n=1 Tax=Staphylococcus haemolyticus TaxID=1283 RepID=UPI00265BA406|nr:IS3 family transposase [Staphylococcus haemolyticus]MDO0971498.1 IS3 family transposase [Staphylococcus haemolyticus]
MCKVLKIPRSTYYDSIKRNSQIQKDDDLELENIIIDTFNSNRKSFETRKIKNELSKIGIIVSRRKIGRIMKKYNLISVYTKPKYKNHQKETNEKLIKNRLNRSFKREQPLEVLVSDLTYVYLLIFSIER